MKTTECGSCPAPASRGCSVRRGQPRLVGAQPLSAHPGCCCPCWPAQPQTGRPCEERSRSTPRVVSFTTSPSPRAKKRLLLFLVAVPASTLRTQKPASLHPVSLWGALCPRASISCPSWRGFSMHSCGSSLCNHRRWTGANTAGRLWDAGKTTLLLALAQHALPHRAPHPPPSTARHRSSLPPPSLLLTANPGPSLGASPARSGKQTSTTHGRRL